MAGTMPAIQEQLPSSSPEGSKYAAAPSFSLAKGYVSMCTILDGGVKPGTLADVCGLVKDIRLPIRSRGTDYKMTISMFDKSLEQSCSTLALHMFCTEAEMPAVSTADVVLIKSAKVQMFNGTYSLLSGYSTLVYIYRAASISSAPGPTGPVVIPWVRNKTNIPPSLPETAYACFLYESIDKGDMPDVITFNEKAARSLNVRDKRTTLQGVKKDNFYDLLVQVVADPFVANPSFVGLWVSDYTENEDFHDYGLPETAGSDYHQVGDQYRYLTKFGGNTNKKPTNWSGPLGRRSMQLSCFEPHAGYIKSHVKRNSWVELRNVQLKFGRDGQNLEGYLRDDEQRGSPIGVELFDASDLDPENVDPRFIEALRRKQQYEKKYKYEIKKRKATHDKAVEGKPVNSKRRRSAHRALLRAQQRQPPRKDGQTEGGSKAAGAPVPLLNKDIVSEFCDQPTTPLSIILDPACYTTSSADAGAQGGQRMPFINIKFKAHVRVVDFMPARLQDFAVSRRVSEYDLLGRRQDDDESSSSSSSEDEDGVDKRVWEWRFALLLEDATARPADNGDKPAGPAPARPRIWAVVNNNEGQMLTGLDACNLERQETTLRVLREKMFLMWGNLEETKLEAVRREQETKRAKVVAAEAAKKAAERKQAAAKAAELEGARKKRDQQEKKGRQERERQRAAQNDAQLTRYPAPPESDSEDDEKEDQERLSQKQLEQEERQHQKQLRQEQQTAAAKPDQSNKPACPPELSNKPFLCCIRQYGVWGRADDGSERAVGGLSTEDAADKDEDEDGDSPGYKRAWQQMFGIFGTMIKHD